MDEHFPFVTAKSVNYTSPIWIKTLLMKKYQLRDIQKVIECFNKTKFFTHAMNLDLVKDADIEPLSDFEYGLLLKKWNS